MKFLALQINTLLSTSRFVGRLVFSFLHACTQFSFARPDSPAFSRNGPRRF
jgi:hypothetical protein